MLALPTRKQRGPAVPVRALRSLCQTRSEVFSDPIAPHGPSSGFTSGQGVLSRGSDRLQRAGRVVKALRPPHGTVGSDRFDRDDVVRPSPRAARAMAVKAIGPRGSAGAEHGFLRPRGRSKAISGRGPFDILRCASFFPALPSGGGAVSTGGSNAEQCPLVHHCKVSGSIWWLPGVAPCMFAPFVLPSTCSIVL